MDQNLEEENNNLKNFLAEINFKLTENLKAEISARKEQVNVLQSRFDTEISERKEQDTVLQSSIDAINAKPR